MFIKKIRAYTYKNGKPVQVEIAVDPRRLMIVTDPEATGNLGTVEGEPDPDQRVEPADPKNILYIEGHDKQYVIDDDQKEALFQLLDKATRYRVP